MGGPRRSTATQLPNPTSHLGIIAEGHRNMTQPPKNESSLRVRIAPSVEAREKGCNPDRVNPGEILYGRHLELRSPLPGAIARGV